MLSVRLVRMIEDHAEQLTRGLIRDLQGNTRTPSYHQLSHQDIHDRVYVVYRNLGEWLGRKDDAALESNYTELGKTRAAEGVPLSEVVYALILTKYHLRDYIRTAGLEGSAIDLYQKQELHRMVGHFFDLAIYYAVQGYERETALQPASDASPSAR